MVTSTWETLLRVSTNHLARSLFKPAGALISPMTNVTVDLGLQGELAIDYLEDIERAFPEFEFVGGRGDFCFDNYFLSQISQTPCASWIYLFFKGAKRSDAKQKLPITLGMIDDALQRGYWETARYLDWPPCNTE